ncbi:hypothetical protein ACFSHR_16955 [Azotobacter chroococcum]
MDLQDFDSAHLYFDELLAPEVAARLAAAAEQYAEGTAEQPLLEAQALAPDDLTVLVGLYRFYYYQHRYGDALQIARRALEVVGPGCCCPRAGARSMPTTLPWRPSGASVSCVSTCWRSRAPAI